MIWVSKGGDEEGGSRLQGYAKKITRLFKAQCEGEGSPSSKRECFRESQMPHATIKGSAC
jgi:hypothetical protein